MGVRKKVQLRCTHQTVLVLIHSPLSFSLVLSRRTPLDDAIDGKFWMSSKLLLCFGAQHSVEITPEAAEAIAGVSIDDIRQVVKAERVCSWWTMTLISACPSSY